MMEGTASALTEVLDDLVAQARTAFGSNLISVVMFGSAVEGRLRPSSDVNLLFLLDRLETADIDAFREPLRSAETAIRARAMFLLRNELSAAAELFALKFSDIQARHRVLWGEDLIAPLAISEADLRHRLREVLLNLTLRLRERYASLSLREEQLIPVIVDTAGPLRAAAAALLRLQGRGTFAPREALEQVAAASNDVEMRVAVGNLPLARQNGQLPAGTARATLLGLIRLTMQLRTDLEAGARP